MTREGTDAAATRQLQQRVEDYFAAALPAGEIVSVTDLVVHDRRVAFSAGIPPADGLAPRSRVAVLDLDTGELTFAPDEGSETSQPSWSHDGTRVAWMAAHPHGSTVVVADAGLQVQDAVEVPGFAEYLRWSAGGRLLVGVAEPGAQQSDVVGSGELARRSDAPSWLPSVDTGEPSAGWRRLWLWDGALTPLPAGDDRNVWAADWCGEHRVVAVVSAGPTESSWYRSELVLLDLAAGSGTSLPAPAGQLARPSADPSGTHVSVIAGLMSDRGIDTGELVVDGSVIDCGADVTDTRWVGPDELIFAGQRGLDAVVGRYRPSAGAVTWRWQSPEACGMFCPAVGASTRAVVAWVHSYARAPRLVELTDAGEVVRLAPDRSGEPVGTAHRVSTTGVDGTPVDGVLVTPDRDDAADPPPLIVQVHGGPVWCWRDEWSMHYPYTPLLVGLGYAVWHPNHRASSGRGQEFVAAGLHAMGELDASDVTSGIDELAARGLVDPTRVAVTGNSYGGYLAAWLAATSDRFRSAAARSPVTDWVSQHLTSNLPGFDALFLQGDVLGADSDYRSRSPLYLADAITVPMMLMAGAHDLATPASQALVLHRALVERGRRSTLVIYPEEGHGVRAQPALVDQCVRLLAFFLDTCPVTLER